MAFIFVLSILKKTTVAILTIATGDITTGPEGATFSVSEYAIPINV